MIYGVKGHRISQHTIQQKISKRSKFFILLQWIGTKILHTKILLYIEIFSGLIERKEMKMMKIIVFSTERIFNLTKHIPYMVMGLQKMGRGSSLPWYKIFMTSQSDFSNRCIYICVVLK